MTVLRWQPVFGSDFRHLFCAARLTISQALLNGLPDTNRMHQVVPRGLRGHLIHEFVT